jgi:hypothetical protein
MDFDRFDIDATRVASAPTNDGKHRCRVVNTWLRNAVEFVCGQNAVAGPCRGQRVEKSVNAISGLGVTDALDDNEADTRPAPSPHSYVRRHARLPRDRYTIRS